MKNALLALAMVAAVGCTAGTSASAASSSASAGARTHHATMTDVSSSSRRHYRHYHHTYRGAYGSGYAYRAPYGYRNGIGPGDPTAGPNSMLTFFRQHNICAIDEGYGRATRCD
jgi:hypothetical protein